MSKMKRFIDIGANLTDQMYLGVYHGSKKHEPDILQVLDRCWGGGLKKIIITGGSLADSKSALELAKTDDSLYCTVGCHPTRCKEFLAETTTPELYLKGLSDLIKQNLGKVAAIGECGLDYDRLHFCDKETQKRFFEYQLSLCETFELPLFLHCRAASSDFFEILTSNKSKLRGGVVHSFDGSKDDVQKALDLGLHIGINGCSLKTSDNLLAAVSIPTDYLLIETDAPWCEVKPSHAGHKHVVTTFPTVKKEKWSPGVMVKGRNEPVQIIQILEILSGIRNEDGTELAEKIYQNAMKLFFSNDK